MLGITFHEELTMPCRINSVHVDIVTGGTVIALVTTDSTRLLLVRFGSFPTTWCV